MGTAQSVQVENTTSNLPRIDDAGTFHQRFRHLLRSRCLSHREQDRLRIIFEKWGSFSKNGKYVWTKAELAEFITATLPDALKADVVIASPLLIRLALKLGNFPWHNGPLESTDTIELEQLEIATILLLQRYEANLVSTHFPAVDRTADEEKDDTAVSDQWLHGLFFQCMAISDPIATHNAEFPRERLEADDKHLLQAHSLVSAYNMQRLDSNPKAIRRGDPIISVTDLPSSNSSGYGGHIPGDEFKSLLKILSASILYLYGQAPEAVCIDMEKLSGITDSLFSAFLKTPEATQRIEWGEFQHAMEIHAPYLFTALPRLFSPFILDEDLDRQVFKDLEKRDAAVRRRQAFSDSKFRRPLDVPAGAILDTHILAQMATILPVTLPLQTASIISSSQAENFDPKSLHHLLRSQSQPMLLLISGTALHNADRSSQDLCTIGAFIPYESEQKTSIFQLSPSQWVVSTPEEGTFLPASEQDHSKSLSYLIETQDGAASASLNLNWESHSAHIGVIGANSDKPTPRGIQVQSVELITFAAGKTREDFLLDWTFEVSPRPDWSTEV